MIDAARARECLAYDSGTGIIVWRVQIGQRRPGEEAGGFDGRRRHRIRLDGHLYLSHRLAWLLHYGEWPSEVIDHIDGDPSNNRISNLRSATQAQNTWNSRRRSDNTSGVRGVSWAAAKRKWVAQLTVNGRSVLRRRFNNKSDAVAAYRNAAKAHYGEFVREA